MNAFLDKDFLVEMALETGIGQAFIEKDWFVTKVIQILSENQYLDFFIVFTGGTALSKAHKLIERFSEDVDFRLVAPSLDNLSDYRLRKALSSYKKYLCGIFQKEFSIKSIRGKDNNRHILIELDYPTVCKEESFLRPYIKLELYLSKLLLPSLALPVSSLINELKNQDPEVKKIACVNPIENAADKLSAIAWRIPSRIRGDRDKQPDVVRHLHDLARLSQLALGSPIFADLARKTISQDANRTEFVKGLSLEATLCKMIYILESDEVYLNEYEHYLNGMSYADEATVPTFTEAIEKVKLIMRAVIQDV